MPDRMEIGRKDRQSQIRDVQIGDLLDLIKGFTVSVRPDPSFVWRGQSCSEWGLTPSLFRSEPKWKGWSWLSKSRTFSAILQNRTSAGLKSTTPRRSLIVWR